MAWRGFQIVLTWILFAQAPVNAPIQIGYVAQQLTTEDIASLESSLPLGAKPWLITGDHGQFSRTEYIRAFLAPTTATDKLWRGPVIPIKRQIDPVSQWTVEPAESYAHVAILERKLDDIKDDRDINQPFRVIGLFDDRELIELTEFVRSNPPARRGAAIESLPILSVKRLPDDSVEVLLRRAYAQGQSITLHKLGEHWEIIAVGTWAA